MSNGAQKEHLQTLRERYRDANRVQKQAPLDDCCRVRGITANTPSGCSMAKPLGAKSRESAVATHSTTIPSSRPHRTVDRRPPISRSFLLTFASLFLNFPCPSNRFTAVHTLWITQASLRFVNFLKKRDGVIDNCVNIAAKHRGRSLVFIDLLDSGLC